MISLQLRSFSKIATIVYQKDSCSFQQWVQQQEVKGSILQDYNVTHRHTCIQTDCCNPLPTLGLMNATKCKV